MNSYFKELKTVNRQVSVKLISKRSSHGSHIVQWYSYCIAIVNMTPGGGGPDPPGSCADHRLRGPKVPGDFSTKI